jgi:NAD(P)-dependent dehydrogenase (short-subunit alcohol dehydrogenase family)
MNLGLEGNTAIVTGAWSRIGFGKAIALTLAREGCNLVVTYNHNAGGAQQTAEEITRLGRKAIAVKVDILHPDAEVIDMVTRPFNISVALNSCQ